MKLSFLFTNEPEKHMTTMILDSSFTAHSVFTSAPKILPLPGSPPVTPGLNVPLISQHLYPTTTSPPLLKPSLAQLAAQNLQAAMQFNPTASAYELPSQSAAYDMTPYSAAYGEATTTATSTFKLNPRAPPFIPRALSHPPAVAQDSSPSGSSTTTLIPANMESARQAFERIQLDQQYMGGGGVDDASGTTYYRQSDDVEPFSYRQLTSYLNGNQPEQHDSVWSSNNNSNGASYRMNRDQGQQYFASQGYNTMSQNYNNSSQAYNTSSQDATQYGSANGLGLTSTSVQNGYTSGGAYPAQVYSATAANSNLQQQQSGYAANGGRSVQDIWNAPSGGFDDDFDGGDNGFGRKKYNHNHNGSYRGGRKNRYNANNNYNRGGNNGPRRNNNNTHDQDNEFIGGVGGGW